MCRKRKKPTSSGRLKTLKTRRSVPNAAHRRHGVPQRVSRDPVLRENHKNQPRSCNMKLQTHRSCTREAAFVKYGVGRSQPSTECVRLRGPLRRSTHTIYRSTPSPVRERGRRRGKHPRPAATSASRGTRGGQTCECVQMLRRRLASRRALLFWGTSAAGERTRRTHRVDIIDAYFGRLILHCPLVGRLE